MCSGNSSSSVFIIRLSYKVYSLLPKVLLIITGLQVDILYVFATQIHKAKNMIDLLISSITVTFVAYA